MRFLCLHGRGTNGDIFKAQTGIVRPSDRTRKNPLDVTIANLRHALGDTHSFEFVDGGVPCPMAPELGTVYPDTEYLCFCMPGDVSGHVEVVTALEEHIEHEGPFDGIIGFSHGAHLAATLAARQNEKDLAVQQSARGFQCAIFFSGWPPYSSAMLSQGVLEVQNPVSTREPIITIPTAHVFDSHDKQSWGSSADLYALCKAENRALYTHEEGHVVPSLRSGSNFSEAVRVIKKTIEAALGQH